MNDRANLRHALASLGLDHELAQVMLSGFEKVGDEEVQGALKAIHNADLCIKKAVDRAVKLGILHSAGDAENFDGIFEVNRGLAIEAPSDVSVAQLMTEMGILLTSQQEALTKMFQAEHHVLALTSAYVNAFKFADELLLISVATRSTLTYAERLAALNLNTGRTLVEDAIANARALLAVKDSEQLVTLQSSLAAPVIDRAVTYSRSLYEIAAKTQEEFNNFLESQVAGLHIDVVMALDKAVKNPPRGSYEAADAVKAAIAAANSAYDSMSRAAKQLAKISDAKITSAASGTGKRSRVKKASKSVGKRVA